MLTKQKFYGCCSSTNTDDLPDQLYISTKIIDKWIVKTVYSWMLPKLTSFGAVRNVGSLNHLIFYVAIQSNHSVVYRIARPSYVDRQRSYHFRLNLLSKTVAGCFAWLRLVLSVRISQVLQLSFTWLVVASCWPGWTTVMEFSPVFSSVGCSLCTQRMCHSTTTASLATVCPRTCQCVTLSPWTQAFVLIRSFHVLVSYTITWLKVSLLSRPMWLYTWHTHRHLLTVCFLFPPHGSLERTVVLCATALCLSSFFMPSKT